MKFSSFNLLLVLSTSLVIGLISESFTGTSVLATGRVAQAPTPELESQGSRGQLRLRPIPEAELRRMVGRGGASGRRRGGTRGDCPAIDPASSSLTAIVPTHEAAIDNKAVELAVGTTASARPTFWFYIPYAAEALESVRFVVNDETEIPLFDPISVPLRQTPGLVSLSLPPSAPPLEIGKYYHWYVILDCDPAGGSDAFVDAFVQRVELNKETRSALEVVPSGAKVDLLLQNGLWHEALDELYLLQTQRPSSDLRRKWAELLATGGLTSSQPSELSQ